MSNDPRYIDATDTILDSIADGVFTVDESWRITSFNKAAEIKIFPGPASDNLYVDAGSTIEEPVEIIIYDPEGRMMLSTRKYSDGISPFSVDLSSIPEDFYLFSVKKSSSRAVRRFSVIR